MIHKLNLQFTVHEASGEIMVTVSDESTGEVVREIPPSEALNLSAKLDEMIGLLFDQQC
jgi:flagellar protein FlaG